MGKAMAKSEWDELYHLLRRACVGCDEEGKGAILGLCDHLLSEGGDYVGLLEFLEHYGKEFLTAEVRGILEQCYPNLRPTRIIEVGAGRGWLGRFLAVQYGTPYWSVDKRQWPGVDLVLDLETDLGLTALIGILRKDDLVVCSEFLHCIDDPHEFLSTLGHNYVLVVEYEGGNPQYWSSYSDQITKYGADPLGAARALTNIRLVRRVFHRSIHPYDLYILEPVP